MGAVDSGVLGQLGCPELALLVTNSGNARYSLGVCIRSFVDYISDLIYEASNSRSKDKSDVLGNTVQTRKPSRAGKYPPIEKSSTFPTSHHHPPRIKIKDLTVSPRAGRII
jgi:hypothetical protein